MDLLKENIKSPQKTPNFRRPKGKSPKRIRYEVEVELIKKKIGSLEEIRSQLNLSGRKMAQLLLVDPSAWSRWTKDEKKVPPYVYRALQWYMELIDKKPEWHPQNSFQPALALPNQWDKIYQSQEKLQKKVKELETSSDLKASLLELQREWEEEISQLKKQQEKSMKISLSWKLLLLVNTAFMFILLFWIFLK